MIAVYCRWQLLVAGVCSKKKVIITAASLPRPFFVDTRTAQKYSYCAIGLCWSNFLVVCDLLLLIAASQKSIMMWRIVLYYAHVVMQKPTLSSLHPIHWRSCSLTGALFYILECNITSSVNCIADRKLYWIIWRTLVSKELFHRRQPTQQTLWKLVWSLV